MIANLTHTVSASGQLIPRQQLAISTKIAIGLPKTENEGRPQKLDHFYVETKSPKGDWVEDKPLAQMLTTKYGKRIPGEKPGDPERTLPLREFDVILLSDNIEEVFRTELAWWSAAEKKCGGNGIDANRSTSLIKDKAMLEKFPGQKYIPWMPCGDACIDKQEKRCKPSGSLYFMLIDRPVLGSVCVFNTTSYKSIVQIHSALIQFKELTGGRLKGIPFRLVMRPGKTSYTNKDGAKQTGNAFFVNIEFRQEEHSKLLPQLLDASLDYERAITIQATEANKLTPGQRLLATTIHEDDVIETIPEEELAPQMAAEFYPEEDKGTPVAKEMKGVSTVCSTWNINTAKRDAIYAHFKGDVDQIIGWFDAFDKHLKRSGSTVQGVEQMLHKYGLQPGVLMGVLESLPNAVRPETTPEVAQRRGRPAGAKNKPKEPSLAEQPSGTVTVVSEIQSETEKEPERITQEPTQQTLIADKDLDF